MLMIKVEYVFIGFDKKWNLLWSVVCCFPSLIKCRYEKYEDWMRKKSLMGKANSMNNWLKGRRLSVGFEKSLEQGFYLELACCFVMTYSDIEWQVGTVFISPTTDSHYLMRKPCELPYCRANQHTTSTPYQNNTFCRHCKGQGFMPD